MARGSAGQRTAAPIERQTGRGRGPERRWCALTTDLRPVAWHRSGECRRRRRCVRCPMAAACGRLDPLGGSVAKRGMDDAMFCEACGAHRDQLGLAGDDIRACPECERATCSNCWNQVAGACLTCRAFALPIAAATTAAPTLSVAPPVAVAAASKAVASKARMPGAPRRYKRAAKPQPDPVVVSMPGVVSPAPQRRWPPSRPELPGSARSGSGASSAPRPSGPSSPSASARSGSPGSSDSDRRPTPSRMPDPRRADLRARSPSIASRPRRPSLPPRTRSRSPRPAGPTTGGTHPATRARPPGRTRRGATRTAPSRRPGRPLPRRPPDTTETATPTSGATPTPDPTAEPTDTPAPEPTDTPPPDRQTRRRPIPRIPRRPPNGTPAPDPTDAP